jgi:hypothetical protein
MRVGGVELKSGKVINLVLDGVATAPVFDAGNAGEFTFSTDDGVLRFNDGTGLFALNTSISEDPNLKASLGSNWLNIDLSFNPVPFNDLPILDGLISTDSLFDVIEQIVTSLDAVSTITVGDLGVTGTPPNLAVVAHVAGNLLLLSIDEVLAGSTVTFGFGSLDNFNITSTTENNMLLFNNAGELVSKTVRYKYTNLTSSTTHLVTHNLNQQYCSVFCINPSNNRMIVPTSIEFSTVNQLIVTLPSAQPLTAIVTNFTN